MNATKTTSPDWQIAIEKATRRVLEHPQGVVCKHWVLCCFFSELEAIGYPQPDSFVEAVVRADDEAALAFSPIFENQNAEK